MRKSLAAAGLTASLLGGSIAGAVLLPSGVSFAQEETQEAPTDAREPGQWVADALAELVSDGTITQSQADAVQSALAEARPERPFGHRGPRGPKLEVVADLLGTDVESLATQLRDGASVADLATAAGVDVQTVIDALVADAQEHLAQAVEDGRLTQEEADEKAAELEERVTAFVNGERPERPEGEGPRGPRGPEAPEDAPDA